MCFRCELLSCKFEELRDQIMHCEFNLINRVQRQHITDYSHGEEKQFLCCRDFRLLLCELFYQISFQQAVS